MKKMKRVAVGTPLLRKTLKLPPTPSRKKLRSSSKRVSKAAELEVSKSLLLMTRTFMSRKSSSLKRPLMMLMARNRIRV